MINTQRDIASFLLRFTQDLWREPNGDPRVQWRGFIQHVQGEDETSFTDFAEAVRFIQGHLAELTLNALPGGSKMEQEKALHEGFKLWEKFATSYSNMMLEAMERTIQQSEALRQQMDKAVQETMKTWRVPGVREETPVADVLKELSAQVQALTRKVEKLEKMVAEQPKSKDS